MHTIRHRFLGAAGILALALGLSACSAGLPTCDASETQDLIKQVAIQSTPKELTGDEAKQKELQDTVQVSELKENSYDEAKGVRKCSGKLSLKIGDQTVFDNLAFNYTVTWQEVGRKFLVTVE